MVYDLTEPIVQIFDELEELQDFGAAAQNYYLDIQLIKFILHIVKNTGKFEYDIRFWNVMLRAYKTWANLKEHFEHAHQSLRTTRGKMMRSMTIQHANILAPQLLTEVKAVKKDVLQVIEEQQLDENTPPEQHANSATSNNIQVEVLKLLQNM